METGVLIENRKLERFIVNVKIHDVDTGEVLGYSANMHTEGMMVKCTEEVPSAKEMNVKIEHRQYDDEIVEIPLQIRSLWCDQDQDPDFFNVGFQIIDPTPAQRRAITSLIEELIV